MNWQSYSYNRVGKIGPSRSAAKLRNAAEDPLGSLDDLNPTESRELRTDNCLSAFPVHGLWKLSCPCPPAFTSYFEAGRKTARNIDKLTPVGNSLIAAHPVKSAPTFSSTAPNIGN
jgi:hypothetical protein